MPPPLAMRFWLSRRSTTTAGPRTPGKAMSMESLEHMVRNRVRLFLRHAWLITVFGTLALLALVWAGFYFATKADHMRIAAAPADSKFVEALSNEISRSHRNLHLQLVPMPSVKATTEAMAKREVDLAIVPSSAGDSLNWPVVAILRQNVMALIVPPAAAKKGKGGKGEKNAKLEKVGQLAGRRVGIVTGNEATSDLLNVVLAHYGVPTAKVTVSEIDPKDIASAVKNNQVDALFVAGPPTGQAISSAVAAAMQNGDAPSFIGIDQAEGIAKRSPAFESVDIDAGTFGGKPPTPDDSLKSLSFAEYLVARKSYSESVIDALAKVLYTSRQTLAAAMPGEIKIAAPSTDKDAEVVVHPGALAYLSDSQQSFFDRYGDDIFYGLLIFPVFGSAIAGVAGYLRSDTRTRRLRLLQRVLDLVRKAHATQTLEAIDDLQLDADDLVVAIIHQSEHEEFDESVRMSFAFALDQLRFAIAARRTAILDRAREPSGSKAAAA